MRGNGKLVRLALLLLPAALGLGCLGDMNPGADGPVKETPKPKAAAKPSPYPVPDYPETTKLDPPAAAPVEKIVIEPPAAIEKPSTPRAAVTTTEKPAVDKPADPKPTPPPAEVKPAETTPAAVPATCTQPARRK